MKHCAGLNAPLLTKKLLTKKIEESLSASHRLPPASLSPTLSLLTMLSHHPGQPRLFPPAPAVPSWSDFRAKRAPATSPKGHLIFPRSLGIVPFRWPPGLIRGFAKSGTAAGSGEMTGVEKRAFHTISRYLGLGIVYNYSSSSVRFSSFLLVARSNHSYASR